MKKSLKFFLLFMGIGSLTLAQQPAPKIIETRSADGKFTYKTVSGDPLKTRIYTLKNGLTVMMSVNKAEPKISTLIAVKAGSKNDPADNTGLAHYLEHMLFKGTDKYGTKDFKAEKAQLDIIDQLYEEYNSTKDEAKRKSIYHRIDSVSGEAAKWAIANEYDKLMQSIGATGTNAFTSVEQTVYINDIPQNELERWLEIEAERFRNPVLRLFHTELEAVYEEKNISLDNDNNKVYETMMSELFKNHAYGTQTTIGTVEHLKNPSLKKIREYYQANYVPNNMAMIIAGDFDPDRTIALIEKNFSYMSAKPVANYLFKPEDPSAGDKEFTVYGPESESVMIGFRFPGATSREALLLQVTDYILANSKAGLIDLNLMKQQKILSGASYTDIMKDYSMHLFFGKPKEGQSLENVKMLLLSQLDLVKAGDFDEGLIKAIINNMKVEQLENFEKNEGRVFEMLDAFVTGKSWDQAVSEIDMMSKITKAEVMEFAQKFYGAKVVVYKKTGEDKSIVKIEKPQITPVEVNRDIESGFVKTMMAKTSAPIKPVFVDYKKDIQTTNLGNGLPVYYVNNKDNKLFSLYYVLDMGKNHDKKLQQAIGLLEYLGTDKYTAEQISKEFYKLACDFDVFSSNDEVYVSLSGLDENYEAALKLFEHLLSSAKPDQKALDEMVGRILKSREDAKLSKATILRSALRNYAIYGKNNPFTDVLSEGQLKELEADDLVKYIHSLNEYKHKIYYYGPRTMPLVSASIMQNHKVPAVFREYPKPVEYKRLDITENVVYFVDYDMVQAEILWLNKSVNYDPSIEAYVSMFNEYFGGGMASVVFQTIRESKALAYSTYSVYQSPSKKNDPYYIIAYVGTQADKLNEAVPAMNELLREVPRTDILFQNAKQSLKSQIETERITKTDVLFSYQNALKLGLDHDIRKDIYDRMDSLSLEDVVKFHSTYYKDRPYAYCVVASKDRVKKEDLEKYGKVVELSLKDIFGY
jgi:predicted Zn-dependent peptidase